MEIDAVSNRRTLVTLAWAAALLQSCECSDSGYTEGWNNPFVSVQRLGSDSRISLTTTFSRFAVYGDNRNEAGTSNPIHQRLLARLASHSIDFVIHLGDMVNSQAAWPSFLKEVAQAKLDVPFVPVRGNHDGTKNSELSSSYYSADYGRLQLLILDDNQGRISQTQLDWLKARLAGGAGKRSIILAHKGLYSGASHGRREGLIAQLEPLLVEAGVPLVIAAHYHVYERLQAKGITHVISAGGGAKPWPLKHRIPELQVHEDAFHYLLIEVKEAQLEVTALDLQDTVLDRFTVPLSR